MNTPSAIPNSIEELLLRVLSHAEEGLLIGEILLRADFSLRHHQDEGDDSLVLHRDPLAARQIAKYDEAGAFRPLRSAPTLRRGWLIEAGSLKGMIRALEEFYPSALGLWFSFLGGSLAPTPLRETLGRQSGMFRITQLLRDDQAAVLIAQRCGRGCLRTICWNPGDGVATDGLPAGRFLREPLREGGIPLLCREACNLLVSDARPIAKSNLPQDHQPSE